MVAMMTDEQRDSLKKIWVRHCYN